MANFLKALFNLLNHGSLRPSHEDEVSSNLSGRTSDANSEAKMGPPPGRGSGGAGLP